MGRGETKGRDELVGLFNFATGLGSLSCLLVCQKLFSAPNFATGLGKPTAAGGAKSGNFSTPAITTLAASASDNERILGNTARSHQKHKTVILS